MDPKTQGQALLSKLRKIQINADPGQTLPNASSNQSDAVQFPARYFEGDADDDLQEIKNQLASARRPAPITDSDAERVMRKQAAFEVAKQEEWFSDTWHTDSSNPTKQRWAQSVFPEFYDRREQVIEEQARLQLALAKIRLRGPRSREDLDLLFALDQGYLKPGDKPLYALTGPSTAEKDARRGIFNPRRNKMAEADPRPGNLANPLDFTKKRPLDRISGSKGASSNHRRLAFGENYEDVPAEAE